jgi:hypothetical protein
MKSYDNFKIEVKGYTSLCIEVNGPKDVKIKQTGLATL